MEIPIKITGEISKREAGLIAIALITVIGGVASLDKNLLAAILLFSFAFISILF